MVVKMPNRKTRPQPGDATIKAIPTESPSNTAMVRIKTIHDDCQGLWDEEQDEVDDNLFCEDQDDQVILDLARITLDDLMEEVDHIIRLGGYHGLEAEDDVLYSYISIDFVYYDVDRAPISLLDLPDEGLQGVLAGGGGFVEVVWDF